MDAQSGHDPVSKLVFELSKLPGIGEKTATRLAYHILKQDRSYTTALADSIINAKTTIQLCQECFTFTDISPCRICSHVERQKQSICVVEKPSDVLAIEQAGAHKGLYHVLHGVISPLDGIGPEELKIKELLKRVNAKSDLKEVIIATNPSVEGEATAIYLAKLIKPLGLKLTKLAYGLPIGGTLEYTDHQTIFRAVENRVEMGE